MPIRIKTRAMYVEFLGISSRMSHAQKRAKIGIR
jgi:hypothetical protein